MCLTASTRRLRRSCWAPRALPVRVFIDPDPDTLITTNTNAGTTLKQVAFDKSVQRHLGSTLYHDRHRALPAGDGAQVKMTMDFSERTW
jgi:hypothetical protein